MLKPGTYKLTRDVENPKPDRRKSRDWRAEPLWEAGTEFLVEAERYRERDDETVSMWTRICLVGHRYKHESITNDPSPTGPQYRALEAALEPCEMSNEAFFTAHDIRDYFAQWLINSGRVSRELFLKLWAEYEDDGELRVSDPHPQRTPLIEDTPKPQFWHRLIVKPTKHSGTETIDMPSTEVEAFTHAAKEIKDGAAYVRVEQQQPDRSYKTIGELHLAPANKATTLRDPALREQFARMRQGLDDTESAMRGLANELSALLLQSDINDGEAIARVKAVLANHGINCQGEANHRSEDIARDVVAALGGLS